MYQRQNRNEVSVELPRDYSGNAFSPFGGRETPMREACRTSPPPPPPPHMPPPVKPEQKKEECPCKAEECACEKHDDGGVEKCRAEPMPPGLGGLSGLLGDNIGLEELLLLGVIFLIFADESHRDNELLICLLLILFI
ncbi:MAG: hypothetical protein ACI3XI_02330 [Eubacteriales bacterium]